MHAYEDEDSRYSLESSTQGVFNHNHLEGEYDDHARSISDVELDCNHVSNYPLEVLEPKCAEILPRSHKISKRKTVALKNILVSKTSKANNKKHAINSGASRKKKAMTMPKQRPFVEPFAKRDSVACAKKTSTAKRKAVPQSKDPMEKKCCVLPIGECRHKLKFAVRKARKIVATATDKSPVKKVCRDVKHRSEQLLSPQETNGVLPTSIAEEAQFHSLPKTNVLSKNKTSSETSAQSPSVLNSESADKRFWMEVLAGDFKSLGYSALLRDSQFTGPQADVLQQSFYQLCRKLSDISTYSNRFMKTHKCIECEFSISHQCVSVDFTQFVPSNANVTSVTTIAAQSTIICICQFGFLHSHATQPRLKLANNLHLQSTSCMLEHNRSVSVSCPRCHANIVIKNRNNDVCCDFTNWKSLEGRNRKEFFNSLEARLQTSKMSRPNFNELYSCNNQCCQLFHRCADNAVGVDTMPIQPL